MTRLLALALLVGISACTPLPVSSVLPVGVTLHLAEVDGRSAVEEFTLQLRRDNGYVVTYNCGDYFGTYTYGERLTLKPDASTGKTCDQVDVSSGRRIAHDQSMIDDFFADPNFSVVTRRGSVELRNNAHTFKFAVHD